MANVVVEGDDEEAENKRKQIAKRTSRSEHRRFNFKYMTKYVGKGGKQSLKRVHKVNSSNRVIEIIQDRNRIEEEVSKYNENHFKKVLTSKAHNDKVHEKLDCDDVRDRILNGTLKVDECSDKDVCEFLKFLERKDHDEANNT